MANVYLLQPKQTLGGAAPDPALAGPGRLKPPSSITGVQSANAGNTPNPPNEPGAFGVSVDWLSFTVKGTQLRELTQALPGNLERSNGTFRGYPQAASITLTGGAKCMVGYGAPDRPGEVHVSMSGEVCRQMTYAQLQGVARWVESRQGKGTRLDVAFDDRTGTLTVEKAYQAVQGGQCVRRSRDFYRYNPQRETKEGFESVGDCLYLGKRQSTTFVRIYDKALERKTKGEVIAGPWVRLEVEWKEERAASILQALGHAPEEIFTPYALSVLRSIVDFREVQRDMSSWEKARAEPLAWWSALTAGLATCRLVLEKTAATVEKIARWVQASVMGSLAVLYAHKDFGQAWVEREVVRAAQHFKPKHLLLFEQRVSAMGQV